MEITAAEGIIFNRNLALNIAALVAIAVMALWAAWNKHKVREMKLFMRLCNITAVIALCDAVYYVELNKMKATGWTAATFPMLVGWTIIDVCSLLLVGQWLIFVEYSLHQSNDLIKRNYKYIMIPFWISVFLVACANIFYNEFFLEMIPDDVRQTYAGVIDTVFFSIFIFAKAVAAFYYIFAYYLVLKEKKRVKIPNYIVISPTVVCFVIGMYYNRGYLYRIQAVFFTLGLFLIWFFMFRRFDYMDPVTGFFNKKYLKILYRYFHKNAGAGCTVIRFFTKGDVKRLAEILKEWVPEDSKTVIMPDGKILVVLGSLKKGTVKRCMMLIKEQADEAELEIDMDSASRTDETIEDFLGRMIQADIGSL